MAKPISEYTRKRNFNLTKEPQEEQVKSKGKSAAHALRYVIQKHDARRLHYDFRLELDNTLKSWAIPKGPSLDPKDKRLAVHVEDHPIAYANFEGSIPQGQYGGGDVIVWDKGIWQPLEDPKTAYKNGKLKFTLTGEKLTGVWNLVKTHLPGSGEKEQWLLIKENDEAARSASEYDIVVEQPQSVLTGKMLPTKDIKKTKDIKTAKTNKTSAILSSTSQKKSAKKDINPTPIVEQSNVSEQPAKTKVKSGKVVSTKVKIPEVFSPELATLAKAPPAGDWVYEIKFDGYRILTRIINGEVQFFTRNGNNWTDRLPLQAKAIAELNIDNAWLDGEVVVLNENGVPNFQKLQNAFEIGRSHEILYYLFDAPFLNGRDLRNERLELRRSELEKVLNASTTPPQKSLLRFSTAFTAPYDDILASACAMSMEGVIAKRASSTYVSHRSFDWIKLKCRTRQEFVIVGFTKPQGNRSGFGALLVAVHENIGKPELRYAGKVGTGFSESSLSQLYKKMTALAQDKSPIAYPMTSAQTRGVQWIKPSLVCEIEFAEWTSDNILRQAAFIALRTDKPAKDIIHERALSAKELAIKENTQEENDQSEEPAANKSVRKKAMKKISAKITSSQQNNSDETSVAITHPDRIIDPDSGVTKKELATYYGKISEWILPHLSNRPVSILRAPAGIAGEQFFQKHVEHLQIPNIKQLDRSLDPGHAPLMEIDNQLALVGAVQMGTIELHTWGATSDRIEFPDRITLDLDPDPALPWRSIVEATQLTLAVIDELKLKAFLKTTGGKGMHIVIPLSPSAGWDYVKEFSKSISQFMEQQIPERFVAKMGPQNRLGKIFIDYLRNQRGASTVSAYSIRARKDLPVSVPITRKELLTITSSAQWNISNIEQRLSKLKKDPWTDYKNNQQITQAMWKKLGRSVPKSKTD